MDDHTLNLLEYDRLLGLLADCARSEPGKRLCLDLRPELDPEAIVLSWKRIEEAKEILNTEGRPPLEDVFDLSVILERLEITDFTLGSTDLLLIARVARTSRLVKRFLTALLDKAENLNDIAAALPVLKELEQEIGKSIGPEGEILDTASPELAKIRREHSALRGTIQTKMAGLMRMDQTREAIQDDIITQRAGRYVIPVQVSLRKNVPGLVHDYSKSGSTAFVEPIEMVEDNNRLNYLRNREQHEIERILSRLSYLAAKENEQLDVAVTTLAWIDLVFAQAILSRKQKALSPFLEPDGNFDLRQARHPLLLFKSENDGRKVIPVDLTLDSAKRLLVISGINAGGKTVALKTAGLLSLMILSGLQVPVAEGSTARCFDRVLASMGDEQNLQSDLSTFSGHIRRLSWIMDRATRSSLVLLDELGTGTDPIEGAALALAVLERFRTVPSWVMTATHYHLLKTWAYLTDSVENAAVKTDETGKPTYGLSYGSPGFSAGLAMARDMGMELDVVAQAESYLDEGQKKTLEMMQKLEQERALLTRTREELEYRESELSMAALRVKREEKKMVEAMNSEILDLRRKVDRALAKAEQDFGELKKEMKKRSQAPIRPGGDFSRLKRELRQSVPSPVINRQTPLKNVNAGDRVRVISLNREGKVIAVLPDRKKAEVDIGGMKVRTQWEDLSRSTDTMPKSDNVVATWVNVAPAGNELNILGLTVDEALPQVDKSLDQAYASGMKQFTIIHGLGTGRLRKAIRSFLVGDRRVKHFQRGEARTGGEGVTMVELNS